MITNDPAPPRLVPGADFVPDAAARREEARSYRRMVGVLRRPVDQPRPGLGAPVVLVPGFISGDVSMKIMSSYLRRQGHRTFGRAIGANLGCTDAMVERLITRLEDVVAAEGRPVALVGHSRGGMNVKLAAMRRPDLVSGIVVLSAPVTGTLAVAAHVRQQLELLFRLSRRGVRGVLSEDCVTGECADRIAAELASPFPATVPYTSVYSPIDAIIDWHTCLDPAAELVEVRSAHTGMATDPLVLAIVADRLAQL
jgi:triacylglycerol lipase